MGLAAGAVAELVDGGVGAVTAGFGGAVAGVGSGLALAAVVDHDVDTLAFRLGVSGPALVQEVLRLIDEPSVIVASVASVRRIAIWLALCLRVRLLCLHIMLSSRRLP